MTRVDTALTISRIVTIASMPKSNRTSTRKAKMQRNMITLRQRNSTQAKSLLLMSTLNSSKSKISARWIYFRGAKTSRD